MATVRQLGLGESLPASSATCTTSSRVGAMMMAWGPGWPSSRQPIHEGQEEGGGLARAGLGLAENVASAEGFRDEGGLNRGGFAIAGAVERRQQFGAEGKRVEADLRLLEKCGRQTYLQMNKP